MRWTDEEMDEIGKYFGGNITPMTLFKRLHDINPARTYDAMMARIRHLRESGWKRKKEELLKTLKVGYLDIEATNLNGNFGVILTWYIKTEGKNEYKSSVIQELYRVVFHGVLHLVGYKDKTDDEVLLEV